VVGAAREVTNRSPVLAHARPAGVMADDPVLSARNVTLSFPGVRGAPPVLALDRVTLEVREGQFVSLVGASGCGKTSLLNWSSPGSPDRVGLSGSSC
jgi:ABC-type glutathione transport system ATPase component